MKTLSFGKTCDGCKMTSYTLEGANGAFLEFLDYGGKVVRLGVPDRAGRVENVCVSLTLPKPGFGGSLVGRYANRISGGRFAIDGTDYAVPTNYVADGIPTLLHGGPTGFHNKVWRARPFTTADAECVELTTTSPDGEGGFPGRLDVAVVFSFSKDNVWRLEWTATTDRPTPINLTHHVYFNLSGDAMRPITDETMRIAADAYTPKGTGEVPTGEIANVAGTDFDFRTATPIGARMGGKYDHNYVLNAQNGALAFASRTEDPVSGRAMETWTTEPGLQFYAGGGLNPNNLDQFEKPLFPFAGLALETQHYPDSVHQSAFPTTILRPGETYRSTTEYRFFN